jgi:hypothetical protein
MDIARFMRPASVAQIGGFRPSDDPLASWAGRVCLALPGETWPTSAGEPMLAVVQLNLTEAPYVPAVLSDVALITLFVGPREMPVNEPNGTNWELRAYGSLDGLGKLEEPVPAQAADSKAAKGAPTRYMALPIRWKQVDDHPAREDIPAELLDEYDELDDSDGAPSPHSGLKIGGWPLCVQSEVGWNRVDGVEFALQVDSENRFGFTVGYGGVFYIGRRRNDGHDSWHADWQSM